MADLLLTEDRRIELRALLNDDERLRNEYPKVAEYRDMATRLPGTGDREADLAFNLRFVHYLTSAESSSGNPYWEIVRPSVSVRNGRRVVDGGNPDGSARLAFAGMMLQAIYAYAIPSPETIAWVSEFCEGRPLLEMGAGRGYWAAQLAAAGMVITAYDSEPPDQTENVSFPSASGQVDTWHPVQDRRHFDRRVTAGSDDVLFLCWPPGWGNTMASDALAAFEQADGNRLIFIGEPKGGKTGDDAFFDALSAGWTLASQDTQFVSWWNVQDVAQAWVRS
ncbi:MAG: hypothetical protein J2P17_29515 [Mycobacterium sp.]|nr:hypothetical protein [Mycobacterium sp.]